MFCHKCIQTNPKVLLKCLDDKQICGSCLNKVLESQYTYNCAFDITATPNSQIKRTIDEFNNGKISLSKCISELTPAYVNFELLFDVVKKHANLVRLYDFKEAMICYAACAVFLGKTKKLIERKQLFENKIESIDLRQKLFKAFLLEGNFNDAEISKGDDNAKKNAFEFCLYTQNKDSEKIKTFLLRERENTKHEAKYS